MQTWRKLDSTFLAEIGVALFGAAWQGPLQNALQVNERSMRRWISGADRIPDGVARDIRRMLGERIVLIEDLYAQLHE